MPWSVNDWITFATPLSILGGGLFAFFKWRDQRQRELQEKRFERYWKLIDVSQESTFLAKQKVALLLLKRFPEYSEETVQFLLEVKEIESGWVKQNLKQIDAVLS